MALCYFSTLFVNGLLLADSEYFGVAASTCSLCCRSPVLHFDLFRVLDLYLFPTLHTISLHLYLLFEFAQRLARTNESVNRFEGCFLQLAT